MSRFISMLFITIIIYSGASAQWTTSSDGMAPANILSICSDGKDIFVGTYKHGIYKSSDMGETWQEQNEGMFSHYSSIWSIVKIDTLMLVESSDGMFSSIDGGHPGNV